MSMQYIIVRHRYEPTAGPRTLRFLDAVLVENAESDAAALEAAGIKRPQPKATAWEIIPVFEPIDATGIEIEEAK